MTTTSKIALVTGGSRMILAVSLLSFPRKKHIGSPANGLRHLGGCFYNDDSEEFPAKCSGFIDAQAYAGGSCKTIFCHDDSECLLISEVSPDKSLTLTGKTTRFCVPFWMPQEEYLRGHS